MKTRTKIVFAILTVTALVFAGCVSSNPPVVTQGPNGPVTNPANPPYGVDPRLLGASNIFSNVNAATAPVNPYSPLTQVLGGLVFAGLGAASQWLAQRKNGLALNQLASSVAAQPPSTVQAILDHASNNEAIYPTVAGIVNTKLPSS